MMDSVHIFKHGRSTQPTPLAMARYNRPHNRIPFNDSLKRYLFVLFGNHHLAMQRYHSSRMRCAFDAAR